MRPAVLSFAPLLLLPFLACTDTPAEPEAVETSAVFKSEKPHDGELYVQASWQCRSDDEIEFYFSTIDGPAAVLVCEQHDLTVQKDWAPVVKWAGYWSMHTFDLMCTVSGTFQLTDLPTTITACGKEVRMELTCGMPC